MTTDTPAPVPGPAHVPEAARALVAGPHVAHLATVLPDGGPHVVPLWVGWEGGRLAFLTGPGSRKARNLARDPRVAVSVTKTGNPYVMATLRGRVVDVLDGEAGWAVVDRLSVLYTGGPYPRGEERHAYLVEVDRATASSFG